MNLKEAVESILSDFEKLKASGTNYIWGQAYERALAETDPSRKSRSVAFAETVLYGRRLQLEKFPDDPEAKQELEALKVAIQHLRSSCTGSTLVRTRSH
jgi:hypothetical protein